jgi:serine/threonine protein kinase
MDTIPGDDPMANAKPLDGLDPADLLRQGVAEDTILNEASPAFQPPAMEEIAAAFPQFDILELIGIGGMGAVYKVRQRDLDRIVALKILPPVIGQSPEFSERFTREARALAKLNHPGIVTLHEFGKASSSQLSILNSQPLHFFLMEFVDGVNLAQLMKSGRVSAREALAIVPQICDALQYAHDQGIVHRDIKPENILLDRQGRVKVADFGIAKVVAAVCDPLRSGDTPVPENQTLAGKIIGTPQYMAPEQIEHPSEVDHRADIYALGVVFYQMLTGELPGKDLQAPSRKLQIDVRLDEIVLKALEKNPDQRYQQASVLKTRVDGLRTPEHVQPPPLMKPVQDSKRSWWWVYLAMFPVGLMLGIAAGWMCTYLVPKKYEASAVLEVKPSNQVPSGSGFFASQFETITSRKTLTTVADQLDLSKRWMAEQDDVFRILKQNLTVENILETDRIIFRVRHTSQQDALDITNAVISAYQKNYAGEIIVHDPPSLALFPVSPNVPLVLVAGGLAGLILSPILALILIKLLRRRLPDPAPVIPESETELHSNQEAAGHADSRTRMDPCAIASFALGIGSFILWPLGALPAIVFGHVSRARIWKNPALEGKGFALVGLILGYLFLALSILFLIFVIMTFFVAN